MSIFKRKQARPVDRSWCVAQDVRPFGYRIESRGHTRLEALRLTSGSRYLTVMSLEDAVAYNRRSAADGAFFNTELKAYTSREDGR